MNSRAITDSSVNSPGMGRNIKTTMIDPMINPVRKAVVMFSKSRASRNFQIGKLNIPPIINANGTPKTT